MLTRQEAAAPAHPAYRPYRAEVTRLLRLSPHLVRVTFTGPDLTIGWGGFDQRIKLMFPLDGRLADVGAADERTVRDGTWYLRWRGLPEDERCPVRTYTIRAARPDQREVDVDMVLHPGGDGPAVRWLRTAAPGDRLVMVAPDPRADATGIDWHPGTARHQLLVGDETAAPAICTIVEQSAGTAQAFVEVPTAADILSVYPRGRSRITWLTRDGGCTTAEGFRPVAPRGALLEHAVRGWLARHTTALAGVTGAPGTVEDVDVDTTLLWDSPPDPTSGDFYAWVAGEAAVVRDLRRLLVGEVGLARTNAAFMGYWRQGRAEAQ